MQEVPSLGPDARFVLPRSSLVCGRTDGCLDSGPISLRRGSCLPQLCMVVIRTPNGETVEYRLRHDARGLRLELSAGSYDLLAMLDEGWQIVGTKTYAAERLLRRAGLLASDIDRLPRAHRYRWRRSLRNEPDEGISQQASA